MNKVGVAVTPRAWPDCTSATTLSKARSLAKQAWALSGVTLTTEVFGSIFTPRMAAAATALWSLGTAFLLFHLTRNAAQECARNQRRVLVRNLLASPRAADHERAEAMIDAVGPVLGHDFTQGANRTHARWVLALVVTLLSVTTFLVRVNAEQQSAVDDPLPAAVAPRLH